VPYFSIRLSSREQAQELALFIFTALFLFIFEVSLLNSIFLLKLSLFFKLLELHLAGESLLTAFSVSIFPLDIHE